MHIIYYMWFLNKLAATHIIINLSFIVDGRDAARLTYLSLSPSPLILDPDEYFWLSSSSRGGLEMKVFLAGHRQWNVMESRRK